MKTSLLLVLLALAAPVSAHADDTSRKAKAKELLLLFHIDTLTQNVMTSVLRQAGSDTSRAMTGTLSADQQSKLADLQVKIAGLIQQKLSWQALEPQYVDLYAATFSEQEIDGIIAFYKSPPGVAMLTKGKDLTSGGMKLMESTMTAIQPQIVHMTEDFVKANPSAVAAPSTPAKPASKGDAK